MKILSVSASVSLAAISLLTTSVAAAEKKEPPLKPCTIRSPTGFFDLNPLAVQRLPKDAKKNAEQPSSWHVRGGDATANFTLNFCGAVVEPLEHVVGLDKDLWRNVSAYYIESGKTYALGLQSSSLAVRNKALVVSYTGGSTCEDKHDKRGLEIRRDKHHDDDDDDDNKKAKKTTQRRKSAIIAVACDETPLAPKSSKVSVSFVGTTDECSYFFTAKSSYACAAFEEVPQQLGPGGVFGVIFLIAAMVYFVGGCVYQRTVMHQRGWKQLPNYAMWYGIFGFIQDFFVILTSSCARFLPGRRGYSRLSLNDNNTGERGRGSHSDDENRLIDQLDEEWDD